MQAEPKQSNQNNDNDSTSSILTDGLLTSLTDAAISNLSQLAALQEQCESQQQHQQHHSHRYNQASPGDQPQQQQHQPVSEKHAFASTSDSTLTSPTATLGAGSTTDCSNLIQKVVSSPYDRTLGLSPGQSQQQRGTHLIGQQHSSQHYQHPHLSQHLHQQQSDSTSPSDDDLFEDLLGSSSGHQQQQQRSQQQAPNDGPVSSGTPLAPVIGGVDVFGANPLANVVAAAAAAAAAANDQKDNQLGSLNRPQSSLSLTSTTGSSGCAMTPASLMSSPDFYQNFKQHCNPQIAHHTNQQHQTLRQHLQHPLHFSSTPSGSITHSNSSLLGNQSPQSLSSLLGSSSNVGGHSQHPNLHHQNQQHHQQRSSSSKTPNSTSSGQMSPISSPNFFRRQYIIGSDRFSSLMSPSPTGSCILNSASISPQVAGSSSSLSHILQHKQQQQQQQQQQHQQQLHQQHHLHNQQRSASALGGGIGSSASYVHHSHQTSLNSASSGSLISSGVGSSAVSPLMMSNKNSSQARLNNMQIRHKFGYLGSGRAQFNSPHGFCLGLNQEIVVADTNNHRVCIFDKSGAYITQFGLAGKEEGQLWNPRKVAILHRPIASTSKTCSSVQITDSTTSYQSFYSPTSSSPSPSKIMNSGQLTSVGGAASVGIGSITQSGPASGLGSRAGAASGAATCNLSEPLYVVCDRGAERSRMQLFTKDGTFVKKIAIHYIDIVAGLATTQNGLIIVVDSVSPTVYIINGETGVLSSWFDCSGHMKEPSDIAVKSDIPVNEYFICDFKGHCVVVFSEQGEYLRRIGHDGLTSYPNGIDISDDGDILVGDSHGNRFHVVVFDRNGTFVSQFECPHVKVSRCCGLKITREGYIVTLAKNNHHVLVLDTIHI